VTAVLAADSTINGTVELRNGSNLIVRTPDEADENETTELTIAEGGKLIIGGDCGVGANSEQWKIVNNGTIEQFGRLDQGENHFYGNEPLEFANLRDLACELYNRLKGYDNMVDVDYETTGEWGIADLHWVYDYPDGGSQMYNDENPDDSDYDAIGAFSWLIKNGIIPEYNATTSPKLNPYSLITKAEAATLMNKLGNKIAGTTDVIYSTLSGEIQLCRTENIPIENEAYKTSELRRAIDELEEKLPLPTVNESVFYQFSRDKNQNDEWIDVVIGQSDNTIRNTHFTDAVTIECTTTQFEENDKWGGEIRFENCQFDADVTVYYNDNCNCRVDFTNSCTFGNSAAVKVVKGEGAKLFRDVRVELGGMPEGAGIEANAPVNVNNENRLFVMNGLPVVGGAGVDFDCNADHGDSDYESIDHGIACDSGNYCLRVDIFEGSTVTINTGDVVDITSIQRLNNAGTISISGSLTVNELNNQCWWDDYENQEEGRTAHMVKGAVVVNPGGALTVSRLNNEEHWEGEGEDAQKIDGASVTNGGTITVNATNTDTAIAASQLGDNVIINLQVEDDYLPENESITVRNLTVSRHFYTEGNVTVTGTLTIETDAELEVASIGSLTYTGSDDVNNHGKVLKTISYINSLETVFHQSDLSGVTADIALVSLVVTEPITISENTDVDFLVIVQEDEAAGELTVSGDAVITVSCGEITYLGCDSNAINGIISKDNGAIVVRAKSE